MIGDFAVSKAGHDKGQMYLIIDEDDKFFYLSDGNRKKASKPKKKSKKHIQIVKNDLNATLPDKLINREIPGDEEIKHAIKLRTNRR